MPLSAADTTASAIQYVTITPKAISAAGTLMKIAAIGSSIGLPLGGVLVDQANYHWIFWVAATMGLLATLTTHLFVPASPVRTQTSATAARSSGW